MFLKADYGCIAFYCIRKLALISLAEFGSAGLLYTSKVHIAPPQASFMQKVGL
jgi:hypothetical protein